MTTQSAQHTPGTIDDANTALAIARTAQERLLACEALIAAAEKTARSIRHAIAATRTAS